MDVLRAQQDKQSPGWDFLKDLRNESRIRRGGLYRSLPHAAQEQAQNNDILDYLDL
jgi:hypothetical protein